MVARVIAGRYALETEVGHGGMGAVWRGTDQVLGRTVAVKKIGMAPGGFTPNALRAEREAQLAAKLSHANVVSVFDLVSDTAPDGSGAEQWLVMEYVDGTDLSALVKRRGPLSPDEVAPILAQTATALAAAHGAGIVHRDVKPSNILLTPTGQVKLSDFGIARTQGDPALTQTGLVTGSPAYLSPEVASGQAATPASDVWSWGATMFHALEGRPPYEMGDNLLGALYRIVHEEPPRASAAGWLAPVLEGTMTRDPRSRWAIADARAYLEDGPGRPQPVATSRRALTSVQPPIGPPATTTDSGTTVLPPPASVPPTPPRATAPGRGRRRQPWALIAGLAALVVLGTAIAFWLGLRDHDDDVPATLPNTNTSSSASQSPSDSGSPSPSPDDAPTRAAMEDFARNYISTAVADPRSAFTLLTPQFQESSGGFEGYDNFWGTVRQAEVLSVTADPDDLTVSYTYRYVVSDREPIVQDVSLQLAFQDGSYLIAGEA